MTTLLKIFDLEIGKEYTFFFQVSSYDYNFCLKQIIEAYSRPGIEKSNSCSSCVNSIKCYNAFYYHFMKNIQIDQKNVYKISFIVVNTRNYIDFDSITLHVSTPKL